MSKSQLLVYFGHHKCATVWVHTILTEICKVLSLKIEYVHSQKQFEGDLGKFIKKNAIDFLTYANADIDFTSKLNEFKGFHVIRDPRDIAISSYFSHLNSHPTDDWDALVKHRKRLHTVSKEEGLLLDMEFIHQDVFERLSKWDYLLPDVLEIKMEELTKEPFKYFSSILDHLGIINKENATASTEAIHLKTLKKIINKKRFAVLSGGREHGEENSKHHFRKGIAGDWKNHFLEEHKKYFKERYNDLLIKLGYEENVNW